MKTFVNALSRAVRKAPWVVIVATVVASMALGAASGNFQPAEDQNEAFAPEAPALVAQSRIGEVFGSSQRVMQILISSESGDVITIDGLDAVTAIETSIRESDLAQFLADRPDNPAIVSYLAPLQLAIANGAPAPVTEEEVKSAFNDGYDQSPRQQQEFTALLLPANVDVSSATSDLGIIAVSYEGNDDFDVSAERASIAADAVMDAELPDGIVVEPFNSDLIFANQDDFTAEISRMFIAAGFIIISVLAAVYLVKPVRRSMKALANVGFVLLVAAIVYVTLPPLAAIFPDLFGESIAEWETGPVALAAAGVLLLVFAMWSIASGRLRRTVADTMLTMATIFFAISWMNGIGYLIYGGSGPMTQILPILLIGLGVDYAIHLTSRYREDVARGTSVDDSISRAIKTVGVALALATVTTAVGFLTNVFNQIPALREFGLLAAVGIGASFLLTLTFVPAVREVLDRRAERNDRLDHEAMAGSSSRVLPRLIGSTSVLARRFAVQVTIISIVLGVVAGWATFTQLEASFSFLDFVPTTSPIRDTAVLLTDRFEFPETTSVLVEGDDLASAESWNSLAAATSGLVETEDVISIDGFPLAASPVSVVSQLTNPESPGFSQPVADAAAAVGLGQDLTASGDMTPVYDAAFAAAPEQMAQVLARSDFGAYATALFSVQTQAGEDGITQLNDGIETAFAPVVAVGDSATPTSDAIIGDVVVTTLRDSQVSSLLLTLGAALLLLILNFWFEVRRPFLGIITTIPVGLVVLLAFGIMAALGIPFGPVTATIAAMAIGIGIPYMIHITHRYEEDRARLDGPDEAITSTLTFTGGALAGSAITTIAGFGILVVSSTIPFRQFGFVTAYTILLALLAAVLILPSYLYLWDGWHRKRGSQAMGHLPSPAPTAVEDPVTQN